MKKVYRIVGTAALCAAVVCAVMGVWMYFKEEQAGEEYTELQQTAHIETQQNGQTDKEELQEGSVEIPIDFESLQKRNGDVYAWIQIPGTVIDYPILQNGEDDSYYLTHTLDREEKAEGAIYTERCNSKDFNDPNTVIYGHDMRNGSMFQNLHNYLDQSFFDSNRDIIIYTPDAVRHYRVFAAYLYDDRHIMESFEFTDKAVYRAYLDGIFSIRDMNAHIDRTVEVGTDDKIITLSTCYGTQADRRYLVQAVLVSIEK